MAVAVAAVTFDIVQLKNSGPAGDMYAGTREPIPAEPFGVFSAPI